MSVKRGGASGRGRGGPSQRGGFQTSEDAPSHAERAAELLARARLQGKAPPTAAAAAATPPPTRTPSSEASTKPISIPELLKKLANPALGSNALSVKDAIPIAGKLVRAKLNTEAQLEYLSEALLERAGISSEADRNRVLVALGVRSAGLMGKRKAPEPSAATKRRRQQMDDVALSRDYGNYDPTAHLASSRRNQGEEEEYVFNEVLDAEVLRGRYAFVNRAPVMTAWTTVVLERLGFQRAEALSLAHVYVDTTSTSRGISIGVYDESHRDRTTATASQPHFELMGLRIPVMRMNSGQGQWRGISRGEVVGPERAFNYLKKSMAQTLPMVMGSLSLLADSFVDPLPATAESHGEDLDEAEDKKIMQVKKKEHDDGHRHPVEEDKPATTEPKKEEEQEQIPSHGPDVLHAHAYDLYCQFRPSTGGEWGKKAKLELGKVLALRRGDVGVEAWEEGRLSREEREEKEWEDELARLAEGGDGAPTTKLEEEEDDKQRRQGQPGQDNDRVKKEEDEP